MPLIIVTGLPCSGKTHRANQIVQEFRNRIAAQSEPSIAGSSALAVTHLQSNHASLDPPTAFSSPGSANTSQPERHNALSNFSPPSVTSNPRDIIYNSAKVEKTSRAEEFSAIKRALNKTNVVVADSPNYIKGFRYQLWCEAKAAGTRCVVVHAAAREDECRKWNDGRLKAWGWEEDTSISTTAASADTVTTSTTSANAGVRESAIKAHGLKVGRDVLGDLVPESHTAIYGDSIPFRGDGNGSRSSSVGAALSDDGEEVESMNHDRATRGPKNDAMTLKSLYIRDNVADEDDEEKPGILNNFESRIGGSDIISDIRTVEQDVFLPSPTLSLPYSNKTLTSLSMRYEPPSPFTRWDTPLFTVPSSDAHPPYDAIWTALYPSTKSAFTKKPVSTNMSTPGPASASTLLGIHQQLNSQTKSTTTHPPPSNPTPTSTAAASTLQPQTPTSIVEGRSAIGGGGTTRLRNTDEGRDKARVEEVKQHAATVLPTATRPNALQQLESATGEVVKLLLVAAREKGIAEGHDTDEGEEVVFVVPRRTPTVPGVSLPTAAAEVDGTEVGIVVPPGLNLNQPMLQRARRKFTQIQRGGIAHGQGYLGSGGTREEVVDGFVRFLEAEWEDD